MKTRNNFFAGLTKLMPNPVSTSAENSPRTTENSPKSRKPSNKLFIIVGLVVFVLLTLVAGGFFVANAVIEGDYTGKIEPGTSISGVYVGQMTREQAQIALTKQLDGYTSRPVKLQHQDRTWTPTLEQLGVSINIEGSLNAAFKLGKSSDFFKDIRVFKLMSPQVNNLPLEVMIDEVKLKGYLSDISDRIRRDPLEPNVELKGADLVATEGKIGFNVNYEGTYEAIRNSLITLKPSDDNLLQVQDVPPVISTQEFNDFQGKLASLIAKPLVIKFHDKNWTFDQKTLASLFTVKRSTDPKEPKHFSYQVNKDFVDKYIAGLSKTVNQDPKDGQLGWQNNKLVALRASVNGQYLLVDKSVEVVLKQVIEPTPDNRTVDLIVDVKLPEIDTSDLNKFGVKELISEGVSSFTGSATERATNIRVGAKYLDGKFIRPHTVFSFLDSVGEISQRRGYVEGYAIVADQTVPDVGGGICQVSTTTFRAAFYAGLPIVERHEHAYRVSWYEEMNEPVGFDAAVYQPGVDMKFENNTDNWMFLQAFVSNGKLYVQLWGTKPPGQTVDLISGGVNNVTNPPPDRTEVDPKLPVGTKKQVDYARKGLTTTITRVIKKDGVEVKRDAFPSRFQAWPNIFKVGPAPAPKPIATPNPSPAPNASPAPTTVPAGNNGGNNNPAPTTAPNKPANTPAPTPKP